MKNKNPYHDLPDVIGGLGSMTADEERALSAYFAAKKKKKPKELPQPKLRAVQPT